MSEMPRLKNGRWISRKCPNCNNGSFQKINPYRWECDGLIDPENNQQSLQPCNACVIDGELLI